MKYLLKKMINVARLSYQIKQKRKSIERLEFDLKTQKTRLSELETKAKKSQFKDFILK